jgi:extracellular solute-binding protein (family 3)
VFRVSTDPAYPPQSFQNEQGEFEGFDIDVAEKIAKRMGVEVERITPSWDVITAGSWNGRWDLSVGSMTPERQKVLHFTPAYYYVPAAAAVHESNTDITNVEADLDGKKRSGCAARAPTRLTPGARSTSPASKVAHRMAFMREGALVEEGPPAELVGSAKDPRTRRFLEAVL